MNDAHSLGMWRPWAPAQVATLFGSLSVPWWIAGGWAIDFFLGRQTREHEDIDVLFLRRDQAAVRALFAGWDVQAALPPPRDETWPFHAWQQGETLDSAIHDIWCRPTATQPWAIQLMVADTRDEQWLFRRMPTIVHPIPMIGCSTPEGISYLAPEIQLLYKAKGLRPKDEADFAHTLPALSTERRQWLSAALLTTHPQHPWLKRLAGSDKRLSSQVIRERTPPVDSPNAQERVQRYIIERQQAKRAATVVGPFTVLLDPDDDAIEDNLACPHTPATEAPEQWLTSLQAAFASYRRRPAIQWLTGYAPQLEATLRATGFTEHSRETLLVCSPGELHSPASIPGLSVITISDTSSVAEMRENLDTNARGFDPANAQPATDEQAAQFLLELISARAFTARRDGRAVAAGMYSEPREGVTELAGIATLEPYRGQGLAAALTARMTQAAFANGCDLVYLTTTNPIAARVYERIGFRPIGEMLTYAATE